MKRSVNNFPNRGRLHTMSTQYKGAFVSQFSRRRFMTSAAAVASSAILSRVAIASSQDPVVDAKPDPKLGGNPISREKVSWKAVPFPLTQVRLGHGPCTTALQTARQYP